MYSNIIRTSSKNVNGENILSISRNASKCKIDAYRNDQYASRTSVSSSTRTARYAYNNIINNPDNNTVVQEIAYIEITNDRIFQYLPIHSLVGKLFINKSKSFYEFSTNSDYFYIKDNKLYTKVKFTIDDGYDIDLIIYAKICLDHVASCDILKRKFRINIIDTQKIQDVLTICDIDYKPNDDLLSYLNIKERPNIKILNNITWYNYYNNEVIKHNVVRDTSYIKDNEQLYQIVIFTYFINKDGKQEEYQNIFDKKILKTIGVKGELIQGNTLEIEYVEQENAFNKFTKYFWWSYNEKNKNYKVLNKKNSKYYTLTQSDVNRMISVSVLYRNNDTIVLRDINDNIGIVKNKDDPPLGFISINGYYNVNQTLLVNENISDTDGIKSKTLTWYQSKKNTGDVKNIIYEWQISKDNVNWEKIDYSNYNIYNIPNDDNYIGKLLRTKGTVYDVYGNYTIFYSNISKPIYKNNESDNINENIFDFVLKGKAILGEELKVEQVNDIDSYEFIEYIWQRSYNLTSWSIINTNTEEPSFIIPTIQQTTYLNSYIRCIVSITNKNGKKNYITNVSDIIENYPVFTDGQLIIEGLSVEGNKINSLFSFKNPDLKIDDYTFEYTWEITTNKIFWTTIVTTANKYSLQESDNNLTEYFKTSDNDEKNIVSLDNKSLIIPTNGSFLNMFIRCRNLIIDKDNNRFHLISNVTNKVKNKDTPATGTLILEGEAEFGGCLKTKFDNLVDPDGFIVTISYLWRYNSNIGDSWINIEDYNNSFFDIPYNFQANANIQVVATTIDEYGGKTNFTSNTMVIQEKEEEENSKIVLSGQSIEGSTLTVILVDDNIKNSNNIIYQWEYSYNKKEWNEININNNSFLIPNDNTYIGKYIRASINIIENKKVSKYYSPSTTQIINFNDPAKGELILEGNPILGTKITVIPKGLFDNDNVYLDENNMPYRENTLLLTEKDKDYKFKVSVSYVDNFGNKGIVYSDYTPYITDAQELFPTVPKPPCVYFNEVEQYEFMQSLEECEHVIIGIGGKVSISDNFIFKGSYRLVIDGGEFNIINTNMEILNDGEFIVKNNGRFNLYGNLITNVRSVVYYSDDAIINYDDFIILDENPKCYISYKAGLKMLNSIMETCDKINLVTNGNLIINTNFTIPEGKTIVVEKDSQFNIVNANLIIEKNSRIIVYGNMNISGSIITESIGQLNVNKSGIFNSYSVRPNDRIYVSKPITLEILEELFNHNFEIVITTNCILTNSNNEDLIIKSNCSLIIDKDGSVDLNQSDIYIENGAALSVYGKIYNSKGFMNVDFNGYLYIDEDAKILIN